MKYLMKQNKLPCIHNGVAQVVCTYQFADHRFGFGTYLVFRSSSRWSLNDFVPEWIYEEQ